MTIKTAIGNSQNSAASTTTTATTTLVLPLSAPAPNHASAAPAASQATTNAATTHSAGSAERSAAATPSPSTTLSARMFRPAIVRTAGSPSVLSSPGFPSDCRHCRRRDLQPGLLAKYAAKQMIPSTTTAKPSVRSPTASNRRGSSSVVVRSAGRCAAVRRTHTTMPPSAYA